MFLHLFRWIRFDLLYFVLFHFIASYPPSYSPLLLLLLFSLPFSFLFFAEELSGEGLDLKGSYTRELTLKCGLANASDAVEIVAVSFVLTNAEVSFLFFSSFSSFSSFSFSLLLLLSSFFFSKKYSFFFSPLSPQLFFPSNNRKLLIYQASNLEP